MTARSPYAALSPRELEILSAVARGETYLSAGRTVGVSEARAKNIAASIRRRLGALSTPHAIALMDDAQPAWRESARPLGASIDGIRSAFRDHLAPAGGSVAARRPVRARRGRRESARALRVSAFFLQQLTA